MPTEKRLCSRIGLQQNVRLRWIEPNGRERSATAQVCDLARRGMGVLIEEKIVAGSYVHVRENSLQLVGTALVRYQRDMRGRYWTGLEFCGGMLTPREVLASLPGAAVSVEKGQ
jgi:hypothetical protein